MQNAIADHAKSSYTAVMLAAMLFVAAIYGSFGLLGYFTFGGTAEVLSLSF